MSFATILPRCWSCALRSTQELSTTDRASSESNRSRLLSEPAPNGGFKASRMSSFEPRICQRAKKEVTSFTAIRTVEPRPCRIMLGGISPGHSSVKSFVRLR
jgi:hypothetical protein